MRCLVSGGRDYKDRGFVFETLDMVHKESKISLLIEGGAAGADKWGREWGFSRGVYVVTCWALWDAFGKKAGPLRNIAMNELLKPEYAVVFPGGTGTNHMASILDEAGLSYLDCRKE